MQVIYFKYQFIEIYLTLLCYANQWGHSKQYLWKAILKTESKLVENHRIFTLQLPRNYRFTKTKADSW